MSWSKICARLSCCSSSPPVQPTTIITPAPVITSPTITAPVAPEVPIAPVPSSAPSHPVAPGGPTVLASSSQAEGLEITTFTGLSSLLSNGHRTEAGHRSQATKGDTRDLIRFLANPKGHPSAEKPSRLAYEAHSSPTAKSS